MRQQVGAGDPLRRDERRERHHLPVRRARIEARQVLGVLAVAGVRLHDHPPHAAELVELARGERAELRLDRAVDVVDRAAEQRRLVAVDDRAELLRVGAERRRQRRELGPRARLGEELLRHLVELRRVAGARVLDPELEAARRADAGDRRRGDRQHDRLLDLLRLGVHVEEDRARVLRARGVGRRVALLEVLERDEERAGVGLEAGIEQAVAGDHRAQVGPGRLREDRVDLLGDRLRAVDARGLRHDDRRHHVALVLVRDEARRQHREEVVDQVEEADEQHERDRGARDRPLDRVPEAARHLVDLPVEPREEAPSAAAGCATA